MIAIVPGTAEHVRMMGNELPRSARVLAAVDGERVLGIAGLYPDGCRRVAFMHITDELRRHPRVLVRAGRQFIGWMKASASPVHALCDEEITSAARYLEHLGFRRLYKGVFAWQV